MATIVDVAREAGVSIATVSRAMNDSNSVSEEKRKRIEQAMERVGYLPAEKSRLKVRAPGNRLILFLTGHFSEIGFFSILQNKLNGLGYEIVLHKMDGDDQAYADTISWLKKTGQNRIAGVILHNLTNENFNEELAAVLKGQVVVQIGEKLHMDRNFVVSVDNNKAAYDMVSHLINQGRRRIALVTSGKNADYVIKKEGGYLYALWNNGLSWDESLKTISGYSMSDGYEAGLKILQSPRRPDAVFCIADSMAIGCIKAFCDNHIRVPEDIAVCGFGNLPFGDFTPVTLSSIDNNDSLIGSTAAMMFDDVVKGSLSQSRTVYIPHRLVLRESTEGLGTKTQYIG